MDSSKAEEYREELLRRIRKLGTFSTMLSAMEHAGFWPGKTWRGETTLIAAEHVKINRLEPARLLWLYPQLVAWIEARERMIPYVGQEQ